MSLIDEITFDQRKAMGKRQAGRFIVTVAADVGQLVKTGYVRKVSENYDLYGESRGYEYVSPPIPPMSVLLAAAEAIIASLPADPKRLPDG